MARIAARRATLWIPAFFLKTQDSPASAPSNGDARTVPLKEKSMRAFVLVLALGSSPAARAPDPQDEAAEGWGELLKVLKARESAAPESERDERRLRNPDLLT